MERGMIERALTEQADASTGGQPALSRLTVVPHGVVVRLGGLDVAGTLAAGHPVSCEGTDVAISVNAAGTAFRPGVLGQGRVYENRLEIDLVLPEPEAAALGAALQRADRGALRFACEPITETLLRVVRFECI